MNKALFAALVASTFGLSALSAIAADMTPDERADLRTRAERLTTERAQHPQAGDVNLDRHRGDMQLAPRGDGMKTKHVRPHKAKKAKRGGKMRHAKNSLKKVPGALVRR